MPTSILTNVKLSACTISLRYCALNVFKRGGGPIARLPHIVRRAITGTSTEAGGPVAPWPQLEQCKLSTCVRGLEAYSEGKCSRDCDWAQPRTGTIGVVFQNRIMVVTIQKVPHRSGGTGPSRVSKQVSDRLVGLYADDVHARLDGRGPQLQSTLVEGFCSVDSRKFHLHHLSADVGVIRLGEIALDRG